MICDPAHETVCFLHPFVFAFAFTHGPVTLLDFAFYTLCYDLHRNSLIPYPARTHTLYMIAIASMNHIFVSHLDALSADRRLPRMNCAEDLELLDPSCRDRGDTSGLMG